MKSLVWVKLKINLAQDYISAGLHICTSVDFFCPEFFVRSCQWQLFEHFFIAEKSHLLYQSNQIFFAVYVFAVIFSIIPKYDIRIYIINWQTCLLRDTFSLKIPNLFIRYIDMLKTYTAVLERAHFSSNLSFIELQNFKFEHIASSSLFHF